MTNHNQGMFLLAAPWFCMVATYSAASLADNPIVQTNYTSDPAPTVSKGTMYLVTPHDDPRCRGIADRHGVKRPIAME